jgi:hypothetical protein
MLHSKMLRTQISADIMLHASAPLRAEFNLTKIKSIIFLQYQ